MWVYTVVKSNKNEMGSNLFIFIICRIKLTASNELFSNTDLFWKFYKPFPLRLFNAVLFDSKFVRFELLTNGFTNNNIRSIRSMNYYFCKRFSFCWSHFVSFFSTRTGSFVIDRTQMQLQPKKQSNHQGGQMSNYSKEQKKKYNL